MVYRFTVRVWDMQTANECIYPQVNWCDRCEGSSAIDCITKPVTRIVNEMRTKVNAGSAQEAINQALELTGRKYAEVTRIRDLSKKHWWSR